MQSSRLQGVFPPANEDWSSEIHPDDRPLLYRLVPYDKQVEATDVADAFVIVELAGRGIRVTERLWNRMRELAQ